MCKFITKEVGENSVIITSCYDVDFGASIDIPAEINGQTVIAIAPAAFANSNNINSVTITIAKDINLFIGRGAFQNCHQLNKIKITGSGTVEIDNFAFLDCSCLGSLTVETDITNIGIGAFMGCVNLSAQNIKLTSDSSFIVNTNFIYIISDNTAKIIAGFNLAEKSIINFAAICDGDEIKTVEIADYAFSRTNIAAVLLRDSVRKIGKYAFADCTALQTIYYYFDKDIDLADKSVVFDEDAFVGCNNLNNIYFMGDFSDWCKIDFKNNYANPLYYDILNDRSYLKVFMFAPRPDEFDLFKEDGFFNYGDFEVAVKDNYKLPDKELILTDCNRIPDCSFVNNSGIKTIKFENCSEAISIGDFAFKDSSFSGFVAGDTLSFNRIGQSAFEHCEITEMSVLSDNNGLIIADCAFKNNQMTKFSLIPSNADSKIQIGISVFTNMFTKAKAKAAEAGEDIQLGENIQLTTPAALLNDFELHQVQVLTLYEDGTSLKYDAFENCTNLTTLNVSIPEGITNVKMFSNLSAESFKKCSELAQLNDLDSSKFENAKLTNITDYYGRDYIIKSNCLLRRYFTNENGCESISLIFGVTTTDLQVLDGVTDILKFAFYHHSKANIKNIKLPNTTVRIHLPLTGKESYGIN